MTPPPDEPTVAHDEGDGTDDPAVEALRAEVDRVETLPVAERAAVFQRINEDLARELAQLDEV